MNIALTLQHRHIRAILFFLEQPLHQLFQSHDDCHPYAIANEQSIE
jgi:hypothetical protein